MPADDMPPEPQRLAMSRRDLAQAGLVAGLAAGVGLVPAASSAAGSDAAEDSGYYLPWIEARADALLANAAAIAAHTGGRKIVAVVKTNGYGLGDVAVARVLDGAPDVWGTMVVRPAEAFRLAEAGVKKPILLMGARVDRQTAAALVRRGVRLSLTSLDEIAMLATLERPSAEPIPVHVEIDTGYGRMGALYSKAATWARALAEAKHLKVEGISTYYVGTAALTPMQIARFAEALAAFRAAGHQPEIIHAPHSNPILKQPETLAGCNATRPGLILYGVYPGAESRAESPIKLQVAHRLMTRILRVERLAGDHGSIAGLPITNPAPRYYATIGFGIHDGLWYDVPKGETKQVMIRGRLYAATEGRNYNHTMIDLGEAETDIVAGDVVTFFSWERPELHPNVGVDTAYWQAFYSDTMRRTML